MPGLASGATRQPRHAGHASERKRRFSPARSNPTKSSPIHIGSMKPIIRRLAQSRFARGFARIVPSSPMTKGVHAAETNRTIECHAHGGTNGMRPQECARLTFPPHSTCPQARAARPPIPPCWASCWPPRSQLVAAAEATAPPRRLRPPAPLHLDLLPRRHPPHQRQRQHQHLGRVLLRLLVQHLRPHPHPHLRQLQRHRRPPPRHLHLHLRPHLHLHPRRVLRLRLRRLQRPRPCLRRRHPRSTSPSSGPNSTRPWMASARPMPGMVR